jgi:hypothetical protein
MGDWRKSHAEEVHEIYFSPHIIGVTKSKRMRYVGHIACIAEMRNE